MSPRTIDAVSPINLLKRHARTRKLEKELAKEYEILVDEACRGDILTGHCISPARQIATSMR